MNGTEEPKWHPSHVASNTDLAGLSLDQVWQIFTWSRRGVYTSDYDKAREKQAVAELGRRGIQAKRTFNSFTAGTLIANPRFVFWLEAEPAAMFGDTCADDLAQRTEWLVMQSKGVTLGRMTAYMAQHPATLIAVRYSDRNEPAQGFRVPYGSLPVAMADEDLAAAHLLVIKKG